MDMKKLVYILIGITLIAFGVGALSLRHNDDFHLNFSSPSKNFVTRNGQEEVTIGPKGIEVMDGDDYVSIGWDGIKVISKDERVSIGLDGIKIDDGRNSRVNISGSNWFNFTSKLEWFTLDEEKFIDLDQEKNISINSVFADVEVIHEEREDIRLTCKGRTKANAAPKLELAKGLDGIEIKLGPRNSNNYSISNSDLLLKVFIPKDYKENVTVITSSADVHLDGLSIANGNFLTSSGDIDIVNLTGRNLAIGTSSGDIEAHDIKGDVLHFNTSSGNLFLKEVKGAMAIKSSSGDVKLYNEANDGDVSITTTSGDININFEKKANYSIVGNTISGDFINLSTHIKETSNRKGEFKGLIGDGGSLIEMETTSGDIKFNSK